MKHLIGKKMIQIDGMEYSFTEPIKEAIELDQKIIILISPKWENHEQYKQKIKELNGSNVFVLDKVKRSKNKLNFVAAGISLVNDFWIKKGDKISANNHIWISTNYEAHLLHTDEMNIVETINTFILK